jgi:multiple sugar transport system permease protein
MAATISGSKRRLKIFGNLFLLVFVVWTLIPFYWMLVTSLKEHDEIYGTGATLWPQRPTLDNYRTLFFDTDYFLFFRNSMTVALATTFLTVLCASLAAYAIVRLQFPGRRFLARGMIYTYLVPQSLLFIPLFAILAGVGLTNSLTGLTIAHMGFTIPFCTWLLMGFFMSIYAVVFNSAPHVLTIPTGLSNFVIEDVFFWGPIMASTALTVIPPLLVYFFFQRWLITGLTMGAVKA